MHQIRNTKSRYGLVAIALHWLMAALILGLFIAGDWMTGLDYYDPWYRQAPWWHKSVGITVLLLLFLRLGWRVVSPLPQPLPSHQPWEVLWAHRVHKILYGLLILTLCSGYLISTADGRSVEMFGWISIPASITTIPEQADVAGWIHKIMATALLVLAGLHAVAALKHHFIDKDASLQRMLGR